jgi:hypothetical protein
VYQRLALTPLASPHTIPNTLVLESSINQSINRTSNDGYTSISATLMHLPTGMQGYRGCDRKQNGSFLFPLDIITVIPHSFPDWQQSIYPTAFPMTQGHGHCDVVGQRYHCPGSLPSISALPVSGPIATLCPSATQWALTGPPISLHVFLMPLRKISTVVLENFL